MAQFNITGKVTPEVADIVRKLRNHCPDAVDEIVRLMQLSQNERTILDCCKLILSYGIGQPHQSQSVEITTEEQARKMSNEEILLILGEFYRENAGH